MRIYNATEHPSFANISNQGRLGGFHIDVVRHLNLIQEGLKLQNLYQIPYLHMSKKCLLEVDYQINTDPITSGFEIVKNLVPDLNICIGYPTLHAYVKEHEGFGFCRYCGFIQTVTIKTVNKEIKIADIPPIMQEKNIPFLSYGYPAEIYDAPVNNYGSGNEITWNANTYLVDMPSFVNNNKITFLAGFSWGFKEHLDKIDIIPFKILTKSNWINEINFLKQNFQDWNFA